MPGDLFDTASLRRAALIAWSASAARLREDANAEEALVLGGYGGRVLVELAANAVDAARAAGVPARLRIRLAATQHREATASEHRRPVRAEERSERGAEESDTEATASEHRRPSGPRSGASAEPSNQTPRRRRVSVAGLSGAEERSERGAEQSGTEATASEHRRPVRAEERSERGAEQSGTEATASEHRRPVRAEERSERGAEQSDTEATASEHRRPSQGRGAERARSRGIRHRGDGE